MNSFLLLVCLLVQPIEKIEAEQDVTASNSIDLKQGMLEEEEIATMAAEAALAKLLEYNDELRAKLKEKERTIELLKKEFEKASHAIARAEEAIQKAAENDRGLPLIPCAIGIFIGIAILTTLINPRK